MQTRAYLLADRASLDALLERRRSADSREPLSEHKSLRIGGAARELVVDGKNGHLLGYAHASRHLGSGGVPGHWAIELVVDPVAVDSDHVIANLVEAMLSGIPGADPVTLWAWRTDDVRFAMDRAWPQVRALHEMRRPLPVKRIEAMPDSYRLSTFRPGVDELAWLEANNAAFAGHPENGKLDLDNLAVRTRQPWFDPEGFLLAWSEGGLAGFCWTKLHPGGIGEIYIIGIVPAEQGRGLGSALVVAGLRDLAERQGAGEAMLYVAEEDGAAMRFYRRLGFEVSFTNREFAVR